jgi:hypothetical protein
LHPRSTTTLFYETISAPSMKFLNYLRATSAATSEITNIFARIFGALSVNIGTNHGQHQLRLPALWRVAAK